MVRGVFDTQGVLWHLATWQVRTWQRVEGRGHSTYFTQRDGDYRKADDRSTQVYEEDNPHDKTHPMWREDC